MHYANLLGISKFGNIYFFGNRKNKGIALTFDDGPSKQTKKILKILKKHHIKATFFILGKRIHNNEKMIKEILKQGSEIGNHSYTHASLAFKSKKGIVSEIEKTDKRLEKLGIKTNLFRPPYGRIGLKLISICKEIEKKIILWDVDPKDWKEQDGNVILKNILKKTKNGSIIDLHDYVEGIGENRKITKILEISIPKLKEKGYKFLTVSKLIK